MDWTIEHLQQTAAAFLNAADNNRISAKDALRPDLMGLRIFEEPLLAVASADDPLFATLRQPEIVHPDVWLPRDWLPDARSVISFFLPFTDAVKRSNEKDADTPSDEWLHARIEGQDILCRLAAALCAALEADGISTVFPTTDPRFRLLSPYISNWSERHVAFIAGLGTFGFSRGLITAKGIAGRFGSIVTNAVLPATERTYSGAFDSCIQCGKCAKNCPAHAFDLSKGIANAKDQTLCSAYVKSTRLPPQGARQRVYYGCGKCQVGVPCASGIPAAGRAKA